jgi:DNA invertase Pin-like site-specific DNA recombinase
MIRDVEITRELRVGMAGIRRLEAAQRAELARLRDLMRAELERVRDGEAARRARRLELIRAAAEAGMPQAEIARALGVSKQRVSWLIRHRLPDSPEVTP